jgi:hypothetical protein
MKTTQLLDRPSSSTAKASGIAKDIVMAVLKQNYVPEDVEKAVNMAILRFTDNIKNAAREELKYQRIQKIPPNTAV